MAETELSVYTEKILTELFELPELNLLEDRILFRKITERVYLAGLCSQLGDREKREIINGIFNGIRGSGTLTDLLKDDSINEIMVNGYDRVFIERNGRMEASQVKFSSPEALEDLIFNLVGRTNRMINESAPIVDIRLEDGSRMNAVLKPIACDGPILTIRKFRKQILSLENLIESETLNETVAAYLKKAIFQRKNILVSGGTGSGKTTLLNILGGFIPETERVITIEDSSELQLRGIQNLVRLECRNKNGDGQGFVGIRELIRASLRMRPDRIIVGEVRGAEALDMLQAMNTGHDGSMTTGHGNSALDMLSRLETMVICDSPLPLEAIRRQIASAVEIIVHMERHPSGKRYIKEIQELQGYAYGEYVLEDLKELFG